MSRREELTDEQWTLRKRRTDENFVATKDAGRSNACLRGCKISAPVLVRFDDHDANYVGFVQLACVVILLKNYF
jgi:hypothetical protein